MLSNCFSASEREFSPEILGYIRSDPEFAQALRAGEDFSKEYTAKLRDTFGALGFIQLTVPHVEIPASYRRQTMLENQTSEVSMPEHRIRDLAFQDVKNRYGFYKDLLGEMRVFNTPDDIAAGTHESEYYRRRLSYWSNQSDWAAKPKSKTNGAWSTWLDQQIADYEKLLQLNLTSAIQTALKHHNPKFDRYDGKDYRPDNLSLVDLAQMRISSGKSIELDPRFVRYRAKRKTTIVSFVEKTLLVLRGKRAMRTKNFTDFALRALYGQKNYRYTLQDNSDIIFRGNPLAGMRFAPEASESATERMDRTFIDTAYERENRLVAVITTLREVKAKWKNRKGISESMIKEDLTKPIQEAVKGTFHSSPLANLTRSDNTTSNQTVKSKLLWSGFRQFYLQWAVREALASSLHRPFFDPNTEQDKQQQRRHRWTTVSRRSRATGIICGMAITCAAAVWGGAAMGTMAKIAIEGEGQPTAAQEIAQNLPATGFADFFRNLFTRHKPGGMVMPNQSAARNEKNVPDTPVYSVNFLGSKKPDRLLFDVPSSEQIEEEGGHYIFTSYDGEASSAPRDYTPSITLKSLINHYPDWHGLVPVPRPKGKSLKHAEFKDKDGKTLDFHIMVTKQTDLYYAVFEEAALRKARGGVSFAAEFTDAEPYIVREPHIKKGRFEQPMQSLREAGFTKLANSVDGHSKQK